MCEQETKDAIEWRVAHTTASTWLAKIVTCKHAGCQEAVELEQSTLAIQDSYVLQVRPLTLCK
jgi:hypothetical protein